MLFKTSMTRRNFIKTTMATVGAATLPFGNLVAQPQPRYRRYNVMSQKGQEALGSYERAIKRMLELPTDDCRNWFRNAFIHLIDCPHGNWWFYAWHRAYLGYFERIIRALSEDSNFAIPYWDWTTTTVTVDGKVKYPIPDSMFNGVLTPTDPAYEPYTHDIQTFRNRMIPPLQAFWNSNSCGNNGFARTQMLCRYKTFDDMWNEVENGSGNPTDQAFPGSTANSRYLTRTNPYLDDATVVNVKPGVIVGGLFPTDFYSDTDFLSFASKKIAQHNVPPGSNPGGPCGGNPNPFFSTLEGMPHNKIHNCIGGIGAPGKQPPYGFMANNLSAADPVFFLHHSNMDRLWDVWTRKQTHCGWSPFPSSSDSGQFDNNTFFYFINPDGTPVGPAKAGNYLNIGSFDYDYEPGFGEEVILAACPPPAATQAMLRANTAVKQNTASVAVPTDRIKAHLKAEAGRPGLFAEITIHPVAHSGREFGVLLDAPANVTDANPDSPYYVATLAFFGHESHMVGASQAATFVVPLPNKPEVFPNLASAKATLNLRVVPRDPAQKASGLKAVTILAR